MRRQPARPAERKQQSLHQQNPSVGLNATSPLALYHRFRQLFQVSIMDRDAGASHCRRRRSGLWVRKTLLTFPLLAAYPSFKPPSPDAGQRRRALE